MTALKKNSYQTNIHVHSQQQKHLRMVLSKRHFPRLFGVFIVNFKQVFKPLSNISILGFDFVIGTDYFNVVNPLTMNDVNFE